MEIMKFILLISFLIDFLARQSVKNSVAGRTKLPCIFLRNQTGGPFAPLRRKTLESNKSNYGYEPYWPDSDWVFSRHVTPAKGAKGQPTKCTPGPCHEMYKLYGEVCGRDVNYVHKTFPNYCAMRDSDCSEEKRMRWMIAYRGKCTDLKTFPTRHIFLVTRANDYIKKFNARLTTTKKPRLPPRPTPPKPQGK